MSNPFQKVLALHPRRSAFNLSHEVKLTCDMGQLIPICVMEAVPGDSFQIGIEAVLRAMPLISPLLHEINFFVHYYFVPNRLMFPEPNGWESFITGGVNGTDNTSLPIWNANGANVTNDDGTVVPNNGVGSLWDYLGFPVGVTPVNAYPVSFPKRAYNMIWNAFFRDETQDAEVNIDSDIVLNRRWEKDYFTSALPWQQRGAALALPVSGITHALWQASDIVNHAAPDNVQVLNNAADPHWGAASAQGRANLLSALNVNNVNLSSATTFNVSDLRLAIQTQKWLERNARGGARYIEVLRDHFGVSPRDDRLQRPEFIGGVRMPFLISEVLQTSATGLTGGSTAQGSLAGHGLTAGRASCGRYFVTEYGVIMGIMSVMPRSAYFQGVPRTWIKTTRYDYCWPEFANLSEQAVINAEVYATNNGTTNAAVFGYQGRYNELRYIPNRACGLMRPGVTGSLAQWNLVRNFTGQPGLNSAFMKCVPDKSRIFAVPSQPGLLVNIANIVKAVRPLPIEADPGKMDH